MTVQDAISAYGKTDERYNQCMGQSLCIQIRFKLARLYALFKLSETFHPPIT